MAFGFSLKQLLAPEKNQHDDAGDDGEADDVVETVAHLGHRKIRGVHAVKGEDKRRPGEDD